MDNKQHDLTEELKEKYGEAIYSNWQLKVMDKQNLPLDFYAIQKTNIFGRITVETIGVLYEPLVFNVSGYGELVVPIGFDTDGCSLPRTFWRLVGHPFDMKYLREAILHDWLYRTQEFSRAESDMIFKKVLQDSNKLEPWKIETIFWGLRAGGWVAWNSNAKKLQEVRFDEQFK